MDVTYDELLAELSRLSGDKPTDENARTVAEWSARWKTSDEATRKILHRLQASNCVEMVHVQKMTLNGVARRVPAYVVSIPKMSTRVDKKIINFSGKIAKTTMRNAHIPAANSTTQKGVSSVPRYCPPR